MIRWNFVLTVLVAIIAMPCFETASAYDKKPFVIFVAGGSASGKTFTAKKIIQALGPERSTLMSMDNYYAPEKQPEKFYLNGSINYDHPSAVDLKKLALHLRYLKSGFPVRVKEYTYGKAVEQPTYIDTQPKEFVVVEGIFTLYPELKEFADFSVFVDVDTNVRLQRRLDRDQKERGIAPEVIKDYFARVVEPMHQKYIQPSALTADVIIDSPDDHKKVLEIVDMVRGLAEKNRKTKFNILAQSYDDAIRSIVTTHPNDRFAVMSIDQLLPTQLEVGYLNLSNKSYLVDTIIKESSLAFDLPSRLEQFLLKNPIPVVEKDGKIFVVDHHHLLLALHKKGITRFLVKHLSDTSGLDPARLNLISSTQTPLTFNDLKNNSYRSLASLVRDLGFIKKTGIPHEEFAWAAYFRDLFESKVGRAVDEEALLDASERERIVKIAAYYAGDDKAAQLPGFIKRSCEVTLTSEPLNSGDPK